MWVIVQDYDMSCQVVPYYEALFFSQGSPLWAEDGQWLCFKTEEEAHDYCWKHQIVVRVEPLPL